jgi:hypothetical protein
MAPDVAKRNPSPAELAQALLQTRGVLLSLWLAAAMAIVLLIVACGTDEPSTPTPTPTALPPFVITQDSIGNDIFAQFPASEQQCIRDALGEQDLDQLLTSMADADVGPPTNSSALVECISKESATRWFTGVIAGQVGGLSSGTVSCVRNILGNVDVLELLAGGANEAQRGIGTLMGMMLCLDDDEAKRMSISGLLGGVAEGGMALADLRCVAQYVELAELMAAMGDIAETGELGVPTPQLLSALAECGVALGDDEAPGP